MKVFVKYITFIPTLLSYLKGGMLLYEKKYNEALNKLEPCLKHPSFQNELLYSYYGQTLCGLGRLEEGHNYLIRACIEYEKEGWIFKDDYAQNLAQNTINALEHVINHTSITKGKKYPESVTLMQ